MRISLRQRQTFDTLPGLVAASSQLVFLPSLEVSSPPRSTNHRFGHLVAAVAVGALSSLGLGIALPAPQAVAQDAPRDTSHIIATDSVEGNIASVQTLKLSNLPGETSADQDAINKFVGSLQGKSVASLSVHSTASDKWGPLDDSAGVENIENTRVAITRAYFAKQGLDATGITDNRPTTLSASESVVPESKVKFIRDAAMQFGTGTIQKLWEKYQANKAAGVDDLSQDVNDFFATEIDGQQGTTITAIIEGGPAIAVPSVNQASNPQVGTSSGRSSAAQSSSKESATKTVRPTIQTASTSNSGDSRFVLWGLAAVTAVAAVGASRLKSVQKAPKKLFKTVKANIPTSTGRFAWTQLPKYQDYLKDSSFNRVDKITFKVNGESTTDLRIAFVGHTVNKKQAERIQNLVNQAISNNPALLKKLGLVAVFSSEGNKSINTSLDSFGVLEIDINALSNPSEVFDALAPGKFVRTHDVVEFEAIDADCQDPRIKRYENEARGIVAKYVAPAADTELEVPVEPQRIHRVPYTRPPDVISGYSTEEIDHDPAPQWPAGQSAYFSHTPPSPEELAMVPRFMRAMQQGDDLDGRPL